jgi:hypothetical protein
MNKKPDHKSSSPHSVAAVASMMVLLVGVAVGAYFVEFRGDGLQALMSGVHAQEILMLFGGLAVCTLLTQFMVAGTARPSGSQGNVRDMVRAVLDLDPNNPNATRQLQSNPEKGAKIEAMQQLQAQRREIAALLKGMERSAVTGDPLREEQGNEVCNQLAGFWNAMLRDAPAPAASAPSAPAPTMLGPGSPEPGVVSLNEAAELAAPSAPEAVTQRVERIEASLETLRCMVHELSQASSASHAGLQDVSVDPTAFPALFAPEPESERSDVPEMPEREVGLGAVSQTPPDDEESPSSPSAYHEWNSAQARADLPSVDAGRAEPLPGLESSGLAEPTGSPGIGDALPVVGSTALDDALLSSPPGTSTAAIGSHESEMPQLSTSQFPEEPAHEALPPVAPSFGVEPPPSSSPEMPPTDVSFGAAPTPPATAPQPDAGTPQTPTDGDVDREFAQHFPHFVGQPVDSAEGQVEVTYDPNAQPSKEPPQPTPRPQTPRTVQPSPPSGSEEATTQPAVPAASSNPRPFPESQVIDLRSLGAVEFED